MFSELAQIADIVRSADSSGLGDETALGRDPNSPQGTPLSAAHAASPERTKLAAASRVLCE
jgi:hypothetical protein